MRHARRRILSHGIILAGLLVLIHGPARAQTFSSGSTGSLGAFNPASNTVVTLPADGMLNYTTVNIPSGVTVTFTKNAKNTPVTPLATGDITIAGTISVNGSLAAGCGTGQAPGGVSGAGGFDGGLSGATGVVNEGSTGQGPGGGMHVGHGKYGAPDTFVALIPLFGGSGASGSNGNSSTCGYGGSGGGGAIVLASTTQISVTGSVTANGGPQPPACMIGLGGSGGAIRMVAPFITIPGGVVEARGIPNPGAPGCFGGAGRIRLEAFNFGVVPTTNPAASLVNTPGPVTAASTPALVNMPTVTIASVAGLNAPATPGGAYTTPDITLPGGTTNPVTVTLQITNTPVGTVFQVRALPPAAPAITVNSTASTGTFASSTATATLNLPTGLTSLVNVAGSYTLPTP